MESYSPARTRVLSRAGIRLPGGMGGSMPAVGAGQERQAEISPADPFAQVHRLKGAQRSAGRNLAIARLSCRRRAGSGEDLRQGTG